MRISGLERGKRRTWGATGNGLLRYHLLIKIILVGVVVRLIHETEFLAFYKPPTVRGPSTVAVLVPDNAVRYATNLETLRDDTAFFFRTWEGGPYAPMNLWRSDGTKDGTYSLHTGITRNVKFRTLELVVFQNKLYFESSDEGRGVELWVSDGTRAGTKVLKDINPGAGSSNPSGMTVVNGKLVFAATRAGQDHGRADQDQQLWCSDGTTDGTELCSNVRVGRQIIVFDGFAYFAGDDSTHGSELWRSNGTPVGTSLVMDINTGTESSSPRFFSVAGGDLYFAAKPNDETGVEPWRLNGRGGTPTLVRDINPTFGLLGNGSFAKEFTGINGQVCFAANDGTDGFKLWRTDGTEAGTEQVKDIILYSSSGGGPSFAELNDMLYFAAHTAEAGNELWRTDGTEFGAELVKDIFPGPTGSQPGVFTAWNGFLYFQTGASSNGALWRTDGTWEGTTGVSQGINSVRMEVVGGKLYLVTLDYSSKTTTLMVMEAEHECAMGLWFFVCRVWESIAKLWS